MSGLVKSTARVSHTTILGKYQPEKATSACFGFCPPGRFGKESGSVAEECTLCPQGYYQPENAAAKCSPCEMHSSSSEYRTLCHPKLPNHAHVSLDSKSKHHRFASKAPTSIPTSQPTSGDSVTFNADHRPEWTGRLVIYR